MGGSTGPIDPNLSRCVYHFQFLLHYMKLLADWFGPVWTSMPIAKTAAGFVQDFHHSPDIMSFKPAHIAVCCLSLALQIYGIQVPARCEDPEQWYVAFVGDDLSKEKHWAICEKILAVYDEQPFHSIPPTTAPAINTLTAD